MVLEILWWFLRVLTRVRELVDKVPKGVLDAEP